MHMCIVKTYVNYPLNQLHTSWYYTGWKYYSRAAVLIPPSKGRFGSTLGLYGGRLIRPLLRSIILGAPQLARLFETASPKKRVVLPALFSTTVSLTSPSPFSSFSYYQFAHIIRHPLVREKKSKPIWTLSCVNPRPCAHSSSRPRPLLCAPCRPPPVPRSRLLLVAAPSPSCNCSARAAPSWARPSPCSPHAPVSAVLPPPLLEFVPLPTRPRSTPAAPTRPGQWMVSSLLARVSRCVRRSSGENGRELTVKQLMVRPVAR